MYVESVYLAISETEPLISNSLIMTASSAFTLASISLEMSKAGAGVVAGANVGAGVIA